MRLKVQLLLLFCSISLSISAQPFLNIGLNIGDTVPQLKVKTWFKGTPIQNFEKNKIYIVEFWATWCVPCMASMPRLSVLARKYRDSVTVLAIDIYEKKSTPIATIKKIVDSTGNWMDFPVGIEEGNFMAKNWVDTSEARSIPSTFIVNNGKLDWIGHPENLDSVLTKILNKTWNPTFALLKRNNQLYLNYLELKSSEELVHRLFRYEINMAGNTYNRVRVSPDSVLLAIDEMVKQVPNLKFLPVFVSSTLPALMETDQQKAYEYIRKAMVSPTVNDNPPYSILVNQIEENSEKLQLSKNIYLLGVECCQAFIDKDPYPELGNVARFYKKMANFYRLAGELQRAEDANSRGEEFSKRYDKLLEE